MFDLGCHLRRLGSRFLQGGDNGRKRAFDERPLFDRCEVRVQTLLADDREEILLEVVVDPPEFDANAFVRANVPFARIGNEEIAGLDVGRFHDLHPADSSSEM